MYLATYSTFTTVAIYGMKYLGSPDWEGFDPYLEDMWRSEHPVFIEQDMKKLIEDNSPSFSASPIGPLGEHISSEILLQFIPGSFATSYIVNSYEDAVHL